MEGIRGSSDRRAELDKMMNRRRIQLRLTWIQVASRAGMSPQNLVRIRRGLIGISWDAADGIEDALLWERGSIDAAVNHGRQPVARDAGPPAKEAREDEAQEALQPEDEDDIWSPESMYVFAALEEIALRKTGRPLDEQTLASMREFQDRKRASRRPAEKAATQHHQSHEDSD